MFPRILVVLAITLLLFSVNVSYADEILTGISYMKNGHSEDGKDTETRCVNNGVGVDLGYQFDGFNVPITEIFGLELRYGGMFTYTAYETAYRITASSPESDERIEHGLTLTGFAKPGFRYRSLHPYFFTGAGVDYMQAVGTVALGHFVGVGADFDITDSITVGVNTRKFHRSEGSTYKYVTATVMFDF